MELQNGYSIIVDADGSTVRVRLFVVVRGEKFIYTTSANEPNHFAALLAAEALSSAVTERTERVRRHEYERGYQDGRAKRAKSRFFPCTLHIREGE